ncbi:MAG: class I SAM-dependent methyltransferase, partial [Epsilonproteobacteria bacterium]|nr:class I SAM-dependent methyltransferase [Campylobacterota bacterium]
CRACGGTDFDMKITLGALYPSTFLTEDEKNRFYQGEFKKAPLTLVKCKTCGLVQLQDTVELDDMYKQYWYKSSLNKSMVRDLKDVYEKSLAKMNTKKTYPIHVDIGCNDGTLSSFFKNTPIISIGFDPAENLKESAQKNCDFFSNDYFSKEKYLSLLTNKENQHLFSYSADLITAIAMFYDLPDIGKFLDDVYDILYQEGIFVVQLTDLYSMLKINAFDNICHEHLEYYTLNWLVDFFQKHSFDIFDAEYNKVNGGSLRIYACKSGQRKISPKVTFYMLREFLYFFMHQKWEDELLEKIISIGTKIRRELSRYERPHALGASTKGNTLLQVLALNSNNINSIGEVN